MFEVGADKQTDFIKISVCAFVSHCIVTSWKEWHVQQCAWWELRSICQHRPTFHNGSNLDGPVRALSAAGQNTQGIRAEYISLSDTGSHSTVSFPFRLYVLGNEGFSFSFPLLWITYWNPAFEEWVKHRLVHFCSSCLGPIHTSLLLSKSMSFFLMRKEKIIQILRHTQPNVFCSNHAAKSLQRLWPPEKSSQQSRRVMVMFRLERC